VSGIPATRDVIEVPLRARLRALTSEVIRLTPSRHDPERYHVEKDRIAAEIRRAVREVDWTRPKLAAAPASARDRRGMQSAAPIGDRYQAPPGRRPLARSDRGAADRDPCRLSALPAAPS
jgi:hypothetical protein